MAERFKLSIRARQRLPKRKRELSHPDRPRYSYQSTYPELAFKFCLLGATLHKLAELFEVDRITIDRWIKDIPEFGQAVHRGREHADANVAHALYHRAIGYKHSAVKILSVSQGKGEPNEVIKVPYVEHYPPDTGAAVFWLTNRNRHKWRNRIEGTQGDATPETDETQQILSRTIDPIEAARAYHKLIKGE